MRTARDFKEAPMPSRMSIGNAELVGVLDMIPPLPGTHRIFPNNYP